MTIRADFYLLSTPTTEISAFVCRLLQKIYLQHHTVYVQVTSPLEAQKLDQLLWTFSDISFIPHALQHEATPAPIQIGHQAAMNNAQVICNLTPDAINPAQCDRIVEIVSQEPEQRAQARKKYQYYQSINIQLATHTC